MDAYSPTSVLSSPATVPLGTTVVLVCRVGGVASGTQLSYTWTCPNGPCDVGEGNNPNRKTYGDRMVLNVLTSRDGGTYTCLVREGQDAVHGSSFTLNVQGGWYKINAGYVLGTVLCSYAGGKGCGGYGHALMECKHMQQSRYSPSSSIWTIGLCTIPFNIWNAHVQTYKVILNDTTLVQASQ